MKILVVHNRYRIRGGEDSVFETETAMLRDGGHTVVTWEKSNADIPERQGFVGKIRLFLSTVWSRSSYREMRERLRTERPDVVHVHNFFPQFSPSIFWACAAEHVPVVMTLHNYRLTCLNGYLFRASERKICERCLGRSPIHGVCRRCYRDSLSASFTVAAMLSVHRLLGTWRRKVTRYIALTDFAKSKFIEAGLPADRIVVKPNVIDIPSDLPELPPLPPDHPPHVIFIGRLSPEKGVDVLLRAWALLQSDPSAPPAELHIIGDGPERPFLEKLAHSTPAHPIVFHGALPRPLALAHLRQSSHLVFPSLWYETFGLAVYEALFFGVPILVSSGAKSLVDFQDSDSFATFDSKNPESLLKKLFSVLENDSHPTFPFPKGSVLGENQLILTDLYQTLFS